MDVLEKKKVSTVKGWEIILNFLECVYYIFELHVSMNMHVILHILESMWEKMMNEEKKKLTKNDKDKS